MKNLVTNGENLVTDFEHFHSPIPIPCKHYSGGIDLWIYVRISEYCYPQLLSKV